MPFSGSLDSIKPVDFTVTTDMLYAPGALRHGYRHAVRHDRTRLPRCERHDDRLHTYCNGPTISRLVRHIRARDCRRRSANARPSSRSNGRSNPGRRVRSEFELKIRGNTIIDTSAVNTFTQMDALTYDDKRVDGPGDVQTATGLHGRAGRGDGRHRRGPPAQRDGRRGVVQAHRVRWRRACGCVVHPRTSRGRATPDIRVKLNFAHFDAANAAYLATAIAETPQKMAIRYTGTRPRWRDHGLSRDHALLPPPADAHARGRVSTRSSRTASNSSPRKRTRNPRGCCTTDRT